MNTTTRLKGLDSLVAGIPDLVGPGAGGCVIVIFEHDGALCGVLGWPDSASPREVDEMLAVVSARRAAMGAQSAIAIAYRCEPGSVDMEAFAPRIARRVPLHHVLTVSDEHWWATTCEMGCCDGAIHTIGSLPEQTRGRLRTVRAEGTPGGAAPLEACDLEAVREAWTRVRTVSAQASGAARCRHSADLAVIAGAAGHPQARDHLLACVAPELFGAFAVDEQAADGPVIGSADLRTWFPLVPRHGRAAWKALEAAACWREGDAAGARSAATASLRIAPTALGELLRDIAGAGLTYEQAVRQSGVTPDVARSA